MWVFGYGSLVWRPAFEHVERHAAFVVGYSRRFWQGSTDHRGVPGAPGRVVTLVPDAGSRCWGVAYRIEEEQIEDVLAQLDHREKGGYRRLELPLFRADGSALSPRGLTYVATADNENYLGPASLAQIAEQVQQSRGPSGDNVEYVAELAAALRRMGAEDEHVAALAQILGI